MIREDLESEDVFSMALKENPEEEAWSESQEDAQSSLDISGVQPLQELHKELVGQKEPTHD